MSRKPSDSIGPNCIAAPVCRPRPARSLDPGAPGGPFAENVELRCGIDEDGGPSGVGVVDREGWSAACTGGGVPDADLVLSPEDPELGEPMEGLPPVEGVESPWTYARLFAPRMFCSLKKKGLRLLMGMTGRGDAGGTESSSPSLNSSDRSLPLGLLLPSPEEPAAALAACQLLSRLPPVGSWQERRCGEKTSCAAMCFAQARSRSSAAPGAVGIGCRDACWSRSPPMETTLTASLGNAGSFMRFEMMWAIASRPWRPSARPLK